MLTGTNEGSTNKRVKIAAGAKIIDEGNDLYVKKCGFKMPLKPKNQNDMKVDIR